MSLQNLLIIRGKYLLNLRWIYALEYALELIAIIYLLSQKHYITMGILLLYIILNSIQKFQKINKLEETLQVAR